MKYLMAPMWLSRFLENDNALRTRRDTLCRKVLLNESLDVIGLSGQFSDGVVLSGGNHAFVDDVLIRVESGVLTVRVWNHGPQLLEAFTAAVTHIERNDLTSFGIHRQPNPLFVFFLLHEAGHFVGFHLKALDHDILVTRDRLDIKIIRQRVKLVDDKPQQPFESHPTARQIPRKDRRSSNKRSTRRRVSSETRYCSKPSTN
jgi:hypothetical protein